MGISISNIGAGAIGDPIGKVVVEIIADDKAYTQGLKKSEKALDLFDKKTQRIAKRMGKAFLIGGTAITAALTGVIFHAARAGDELDKMSLRTGETVETLSALGFAAEISGSTIQDLENGIRRLSRNMNDTSRGIGEARRSFEEMDISVKDSNGNLRAASDVMSEIADKMRNLASESEKTAIAQELFGRGGASLLPLLKQGSAGIQDLMDRANELGIVMTTAGATVSAEFTDSMTELTAVAKMGAVQLGQTLLPAIQTIIEKITDLAARFNKLTENQKKVIGWTTAIGGGFSIMAGGALLLVSRLPAIIAGFSALAAFPAALPITLGFIALAGAVTLATVEIKRFQEDLDRIARTGLTKQALAGQAEAMDQLQTAVFGVREELGEVRLEARDLTTGLARMDAISEAVGDNVVVLDDRLAEITATLGGADGFISVTDAATAAIKALAEVTGKAAAGEFVKLGEGVEGIEELLAALSGDTVTVQGILAQREALDAWATAAANVGAVAKEVIRDVKPSQAGLRPTDFLQLGGFVGDPDVPAGRATRAIDFGMTSPEILKQTRQLDEFRKGLDEWLKSLTTIFEKSGEFTEKEKQRKIKAIEEASEKEIKLIGETNKRAELLFVKETDFKIKASERGADERAKVEKDFRSVLALGEAKDAAAQVKNIADAVAAQEQAAADVLRAWERTKDEIQFAFVGLFDSIIREGKADWQTFLDDLGRMFSRKFAEIAADQTVGALLDKLAGGRTGAGTAGAIREAAAGQATTSFLGRLFGTGPAEAAQLPGGGTLGAKIFGTAATPAVATTAGAATPATAALIAAASVVLPVAVTAGIIAGGVKTIKAFLSHRDIQQRIESGELIPERRGARAGRRRSETPERETATERRQQLEDLGNELRGDNFVQIDNLVIQMPDNINDMSRAELDKNTSRQIASTARAFKRDPRARRSFMR